MEMATSTTGHDPRRILKGASVDKSVLKQIPYLRRITLVSCDSIAVMGVAMALYAALNAAFPDHTIYQIMQLVSIYIVLNVIALCYYAYLGHYSWRTPWWQQVRQIVGFTTGATLIHVLLNYITAPLLPGQILIVAAWAGALPFMLGMRIVGRAVLKKQNHWDISTVVVGATQNVIDTLYALKSEFYLTYAVKYVVLTDGDDHTIKALRAEHPHVEIRSSIGPIFSHSMVILAPGERDQDTVSALVKDIQNAGAKYAIVPSTTGLSLYGLQPQYFFGYNIILMESQNRINSFWGGVLKSSLDRAMALVGLILLAPVFATLYVIVRKDGGPAFYGQMRMGKDGKQFKCWKFRSMVMNADKVLQDILAKDPAAREEWAKDFKLKNDPRITKIGHFLRKSSLDEIPQLYNVLRGEMSIVGPRPIVKAEEVFYGDKFDRYTAVRPGITGLWQVSGRNDVSYEQRVSLDCWYVQNWSVWNDLVIIFKTTFVVLKRKGAY